MNRFLPKNPRALLLLQAGFAALVLGFALIAQYGFLLHPCDLCIYQRYPYAAILLIAGAGLWLAKAPKTAWRLAALCAALFLLDAGIAFYHTGVEYGWFPGPTACASDSAVGQTLEDMRAAILNAPLVSCAQAMAYIFGLSMAAWNALAALFAALFSVAALRKMP